MDRASEHISPCRECVRLLCDPQRELRHISAESRESADGSHRSGRHPLLIFRAERFAPVDLSGKKEDADIPERDVTKNSRNGPVLVRGSAERVVVQPFDEHAQTLPFTVVGNDVGTLLDYEQL